MGACGSENRFMGQLGHHVWGKPTLGKTVYLEGYPICLPEVSSGLSYRARERETPNASCEEQCPSHPGQFHSAVSAAETRSWDHF